jgi:CO/xanthine dehydrogenase Mo-binding subunit
MIASPSAELHRIDYVLLDYRPGHSRTRFTASPGGLATAEIGSAVKPPLTPDRLDSWLAVKADGDVVAYFGKMDMGQGVDVAIAQIVADGLDVPFERVNAVMGDTAWTVNQGGASGSTGIQKGGIPLRYAAAEARRVLIECRSAFAETPLCTICWCDDNAIP